MIDMEVFASNEFVRINDVALTDIRLLEIGSTETSNEVCSLEPRDHICSNKEKEKRNGSRQKECSKGCHMLRRRGNTRGLIDAKGRLDVKTERTVAVNVAVTD